MKAIHKKRLLKLARHLARGKLKQDKWTFGRWHSENCHTAGCAMGEASYLWPRVFKRNFDYSTNDGVKLFTIEHRATRWEGEKAACEFFGLTLSESLSLFTPRDKYTVTHGLEPLSNSATRKQVAANIRRLLKLKEKEATNA